MAQITVQEIFSCEKYDVMGKAIADYLKNGRPAEYDERTWLDLLIVKHTIEAVEKMKKEGDSISAVFDGESSSLYVNWYDNDNA